MNKSALVNITVYNINGSLVKNLYNNVMMNKGHIDIPFNSSMLSMGTYLVVVESDKQKDVVKFVKY